MPDRLVYLDNAATSFPKPPEVLRQALDTYLGCGVSPGRGSYDLASEARQLVTATREKLATFFKAADPSRVIFTANATDALNAALQGMLEHGDHVVSTRLEHNSVLRPLHHLRAQGTIDYDLVPFDDLGFVDPDELAATIRPETRLVVVTHASNVLGTIQPVAEIGRLCRERGVPVLVDAAQTAGLIPIDMEACCLAGVVFTGHKSLLAPTGIGGLVLHPDVEIRSTRFGGTGMESDKPVHTQAFPYRLEAGTLNMLGIISLSAALDYIERETMAVLYDREMAMLARLTEGLRAIEDARFYCAAGLSRKVALLTVNLEGVNAEDVANILDADFGIAVRAGLHCAPMVHRSLGTSPHGGVRFSFGPFNTEADADAAVTAMAAIAAMK